MPGLLIIAILFVIVGYPLLQPLWAEPDAPYFHSESGERPC